ncbi:MAG TPA: transglycosylase SLT domain-containing protein, partial [Polyangiaceae bacterium]|nr:transglycosylase SLT domain-containing protein [Polyangiaceae bacterium]
AADALAMLGYALLGASSAALGQLAVARGQPEAPPIAAPPGPAMPAAPPVSEALPASALPVFEASPPAGARPVFEALPPAGVPPVSEALPPATLPTPPAVVLVASREAAEGRSRVASLETADEPSGGPRAAAPRFEDAFGTRRAEPVVAVARRGFESPELKALRLAERADGPRVAGSPAGVVAPALLGEGSLPPRVEALPAPEGWGELRRGGLAVRPYPRVVAELNYFTHDARGRRAVRHWLRTSGLYRDAVSQSLARRNLPSELLAVVFVESGGRATAVSHAGATGLWQLMPATARAYGLSIDPYVDERRGLARSTEAAVALLSDLYDRFLSWDMALAAYNLGYQGLVDRADALGRVGLAVVDQVVERAEHEVQEVHVVAYLAGQHPAGEGERPRDAARGRTRFEQQRVRRRRHEHPPRRVRR